MDIDPEDVKEANGCTTKACVAKESDKIKNQCGVEKDKLDDRYDGEEDCEEHSLLPQQRKLEETRRKVKWNDNNGNQLAEVLIYEPSDASDSDDENADSCFCTIM